MSELREEEEVEVKFSVVCNAVYNSSLNIPKELLKDEDSVVAYINNHLDDVKVNELTWINDWSEDAVTAEDVKWPLHK